MLLLHFLRPQCYAFMAAIISHAAYNACYLSLFLNGKEPTKEQQDKYFSQYK